MENRRGILPGEDQRSDVGLRSELPYEVADTRHLSTAPSADSAVRSLNRLNTNITPQGGRRAQARRLGCSMPARTAPTMNPDQTLASMPPRLRWASPSPSESFSVFLHAAEAMWPRNLFNGPVNKSRCTGSQTCIV